MPSEDELLKFKPPESSEAIDLEWLSQLYGEKKKKKVIRTEKGGGKGEGSSGSSSMSSFGDHDLVCFGWVLNYIFLKIVVTEICWLKAQLLCNGNGNLAVPCSRKDFGMILGMEKDDSYKVYMSLKIYLYFCHGYRHLFLLLVFDLYSISSYLHFHCLDFEGRPWWICCGECATEGVEKWAFRCQIYCCWSQWKDHICFRQCQGFGRIIEGSFFLVKPFTCWCTAHRVGCLTQLIWTYRISKGLLSMYTETRCLYMTRMRWTTMVISAANLTCVRKSRFLMMHLVERSSELSLFCFSVVWLVPNPTIFLLHLGGWQGFLWFWRFLLFSKVTSIT